MERVGLIGVGAMGSILLHHLLRAGVPVTAYDCVTAALETARSLGAQITRSARELAAESSIIDVVVRTDEEVVESVTGKDGVLASARAGTLVLLHSTIHPRTTRTVAQAAGPRGVEVLDACMLGSPRVAKTGNITFLVGGTPDLVEKARPHLLRMGKDVIHTGALGTGNVAKIVKNLVSGSETLILYEAVQLGEAAGLHYRDTLALLRNTRGDTVLNRWEDVFDSSGKGPMPRAGQNIMQKDIPLAATLARDLGLRLGITEQLASAGLGIVEAQQRK
jgi:3-hydroxyisobutyrate dehydrogenase